MTVLLPFPLPDTLPVSDPTVSNPILPSSRPFSQYDVAIGGIGFEYASTTDNPMVRETVPLEKDRIDSEDTPGEQTLTGWWLRSQASFHGGAGQVYLEPTGGKTPVSPISYDLSKNVDPFTPGVVSRLPDATLFTADSPDNTLVAAHAAAGTDYVGYLKSGVLAAVANPAGTPAPVSFTFTGNTGWKAVASDGRTFYVCDGLNIKAVTPTVPGTATTIATLPAAATNVTLGWVKSRLMLAADNKIYELDVSATSMTLGSTQLRYTHPVVSFVWRCFGTGPKAIVAAGDAGGLSTITAFTVDNSTGAPVLTVYGDIAELPLGERVLSLLLVQGSFLAVGTTRGIRVGTYDTYTGNLNLGPLTLGPALPTIPCNAIVARDRFVYSAGLDYDEAGLLALDLGTQVDQAGRFAWAPHLITANAAGGSGRQATAATVLPTSCRIVFGVPGAGLFVEGSGAGATRTGWLKTSRIRFDTTEPKLFKYGLVRGNLSSGEVMVTSATPEDSSLTVTTVGFSTTDPPEFRLGSTPTEWLQFTLSLLGSAAELTSYSVKALPGTRKQRYFQLALSVYDKETTKTGQRITEELAARDRLAQLESLDAAGDEVLFQEYTPTGVVSTIVRVEKVSFQQVGRPTRRSDIGGVANVLLRTLES